MQVTPASVIHRGDVNIVCVFRFFVHFVIASRGRTAGDEQTPTYSELRQRSRTLTYVIPTTNNTLEAAARSDPARELRIAHFAATTWPFLHTRAWQLAAEFLAFKRHNGSVTEKALYQSMEVTQFVTRLLSQRPLCFYNEDDTYMLKTGETGSGYNNFVQIGTASETPPLILSSYMSYDEMQIAALVGQSVPTYFINDGDRHNNDIPGAFGTFEEEGVVVDQVGCRFERPGLMEWQHMVVTEKQNSPRNGYGPRSSRASSLLALWANFYGLPYFPTYNEALEQSKQPNGTDLWVPAKTRTQGLLNVAVFRKRYDYHAMAYLSECSDRGLEAGAYCHVEESIETEPWWTIDARQSLWLLQSFSKVLKEEKLPGVRVVDFARFRQEYFEHVFGTSGKIRGVDGTVIRVRSSVRQPGQKLTGQDAGLRVVFAFAGDGNAYPGNEYWKGKLNSSGDPAAACFSLIPWLQNPEINPLGLSASRARRYGRVERSPRLDAIFL